MSNSEMRNSFSLIIIGYNVASTLKRCLESVAKINYPNFEVIYVDDGSTDNSVQIAKEQGESIRIITKNNGGIISARKEGLRVSKCDYVLFIDGDDFIDGNILNVFNEILLSNSNSLDIVLSGFFYEIEIGKFSTIKMNSEKTKFINMEYLDFILLDKIPHYMFAKCFKREFLIDSDYLSLENISMAEDLLTNILLGLNKPRVALTDVPTYFYCLNSTNMSRRENERIFEQIHTLSLVEEYFKKFNLYDIYEDSINFLRINYVRGYTFKPDFSFRFKKRFIKRIRPYIKKFYKNKTFHDWRVSNIKKIAFFCMIYLPVFRFFGFLLLRLRYKIK